MMMKNKLISPIWFLDDCLSMWCHYPFFFFSTTHGLRGGCFATAYEIC
jgi:hypothetical protein